MFSRWLYFFNLKLNLRNKFKKKKIFLFFLHKCFYESFQRKEIEDNHGIVEGHGREPILHWKILPESALSRKACKHLQKVGRFASWRAGAGEIFKRIDIPWIVRYRAHQGPVSGYLFEHFIRARNLLFHNNRTGMRRESHTSWSMDRTYSEFTSIFASCYVREIVSCQTLAILSTVLITLRLRD